MVFKSTRASGVGVKAGPPPEPEPPAPELGAGVGVGLGVDCSDPEMVKSMSCLVIPPKSSLIETKTLSVPALLSLAKDLHEPDHASIVADPLAA